MGKKFRILFVVSLLIASAFVGMMLTVDNAAGAIHYVGSKSTFLNIQDALNASDNGDTIRVENGTYTQNLTIHKDVILFGNSSDDCRIQVSYTTAIIIDGSWPIIGFFNLSTTNDGNDVVKCINNGYATVGACNLNFTGRFCHALSCDDSMIDVYESNLDNNRLFVNAATNSWVTFFDTTVLPNNVMVDGTSLIDVFYSINLTVYYEDGTTPVEDAEVNVSINGDHEHWLSYLTNHYGGFDDETDLYGSADVTMVSAEYDGTATPTWGFNDVKVYKSLPYKSGTIEHEEVAYISSVNSTQTIDIIFNSDIRAPDKIDNVNVTTINQTIQNVTWDPTTEVGFLSYSVYSTNSVGGNKMLLANTTDEWYEVTGLIPDTTYYYVVTVWDAASLESPDSDVASNKTLAMMGTVQGTALFEAVSRAPMNALVELLDSGDATIASTSIDEVAYNFTFMDVPLQTGLKVKATPEAAVLGQIGVTSGYLENTSVDFDLDAGNPVQTVDLVMKYYQKPLLITGKVTFNGGPEDGKNATNVTVELYQTHSEFNASLNKSVNFTNEIMNTTTNVTTGVYTLADVPLGINYTIKVIPREEDIYDEATKTDGYGINETGMFNMSADKELNITLDHMIYPWPTPILTGQVLYRGGDLDGVNASGATVKLFNITKEFNQTLNKSVNVTNLLESATTDVNGFYEIDYFIADTNFFIEVIPHPDELGVVGVSDGYLTNTTDLFTIEGDAVLVKNFSLEYYEFIHPPLEIINKAPTGDNVSLDALIEIEFNHQVSQILLEMSLEITPLVTGLSYAWNDDNTSVLISHDDFEPGTNYKVKVSDNFTSKFIVGFADNYTGNSWSFNTTTEGMVETSVTITEPTSFSIFETGSSITVSGTSQGFPIGTLVTITLEDENVTTTIGADGNWTAEITAPDTAGAYFLIVEVGEESGQVTVVIEEKEEDEPYFTWGTLSVCIIVFLILIILVLIVIVVVLGVFLTKKREPKEDEEKEERVGKEEWEDEEDWDEDEDWDDEEEEEDWDDEDKDEDEDWDDEEEDEDEDWDDEEEEDEDDWDEDEDEDDDDFGESEMDLDSLDDEDDWDADEDDDDYDYD